MHTFTQQENVVVFMPLYSVAAKQRLYAKEVPHVIRNVANAIGTFVCGELTVSDIDDGLGNGEIKEAAHRHVPAIESDVSSDFRPSWFARRLLHDTTGLLGRFGCYWTERHDVPIFIYLELHRAHHSRSTVCWIRCRRRCRRFSLRIIR